MDFKRLFFISGLVISGYLLLLQWVDYSERPPTHEAAELNQNLVVDTDTAAEVPQVELDSPTVTTQNDDLPTVQVTDPVPSVAANQASHVEVVTDTMNLRINLVGGDIDFISLPQFPVSLDQPDVPFVMLDTRERTYVAQSGLVGPDGPDAQGRTLYQVNQTRFEQLPNQPLEVVLTHETDDKVVEKIFRFEPGSYSIEIEHQIQNRSEQALGMAKFGQIKRDQSPDPSSSGGFGLQSYLGFALSTDQDNYNKVSNRNLRRNAINESSRGGWIAFMQHYFVSAWVPPTNQQNQFYALPTNDGMFRGGFTGPVFNIAPGETATVGAVFYSGPKDQPSLREIEPNLHLTVDYGWLWWIAQPLFRVLTFFQGFVGNWGVAIILLTLTVKALFFYPSAKAYKSMAKMRALAPKLQQLKEQIGDDRQKMGQEMMKLYKKEGVNPLGGCLPILIQMPVFIALYWVLMESVELRQSPFFLWITDLSLRDPYFILPILMGASQYVQMKLGTQPQDPMQQKIFAMMPFIFTFLFMWFPAGLVLYWLTNNLLSIAQQWLINRQVEASMAAKKS